MKIKKFTARTFAEALELVKKELSTDAVILATEEKKGLRPHVEVTAAVDYHPAEHSAATAKPTTKDAVMPRPAFANAARTNAYARTNALGAASAHAAAEDRDDSALLAEVSELKAMLLSMKNSGYEVALPAKKRALLMFLRERQVREEYALRLCDKTSELAEIPLLISSDIRVRRNQPQRKAVMFVGPTGVGKTTTIAKLAAQAVRDGRKAALLNLDTYRIGAAEQSRIYARILGIPLVTASSVADFQRGLTKLSAERDVVFVDTAGRSPRDEAHIDELGELCSVAPDLELHLLMSANTDDACMQDAQRAYQKLPVDYVSFSKIDEALRFGPLYNVLVAWQKPVAWLATGQRVPGDIEAATVARLAGLIAAKESTVC
jgi:flagellar biosynthesis protein FlhF